MALSNSKIDYTEDYTPGMRIYYAYANKLTGTKELYELIISKVYPNMIIAWEDRGCAHMIGPEDDENVYTNHSIAQAFFKQMNVESIYGKNVNS